MQVFRCQTQLLAIDKMKKCIKCNVYKNLDQYYKNNRCLDGLEGKCKACKSVYRKVQYKNNRDKELFNNAVWRKNNPEKDGGKHDPKDFVKDPYVFEFLNFPEPFSASEKELEGALLTHLQEFLLELGKGFSFVGRQFRISTETDHFYIDLVFYNYLLKCFVLIDLKTRKLMHQDIGQMDMYRRMFDDLKKPEGDNPTIGILLCTDKSETVVKYSVMQDSQQLFAAKFMPFLPTEEELIAEIERDKALIEGKGDEEN